MPVLYLLIDIVFYGIIFGLKNLKGSIYVNGVVAGGADVVAAILIAIFSNKIGRKTYLLFSWGVLTIACFIYHFI